MPSIHPGFHHSPPACRLPQPRQGRHIRQCVVTREHLPKALLWRVVRVRRADGSKVVAFDAGEGRSVYISRSLRLVRESVRKKRLTRALKCAIPDHVILTLLESAEKWESLPVEEKGLLFCEVYAEEGVSPAVEEVQLAAVQHCHDLLWQ